MTTTVPTPTRLPRAALRDGFIAGLVAAAAAAAVGAIAKSADVPLTISGGTKIPIGAFALWTIVATGLALGAAAVVKVRQRFLTLAGAGTLTSFLGPIALADHTSTKVWLIVAHLLVAAVVVPAIARHLPLRNTEGPAASSTSDPRSR